MEHVTNTAAEEASAPVAAVKKAVKKVVKKVSKKAPAKVTKVKGGAKKPAKKAAVKLVGGEDRGMDTSIPKRTREDMAVKAMRKAGCISPDTAKNKDDLHAKAGLKPYDFYQQVWSHSRLQLTGFVKQCVVEGVRGPCFYLTKKGQTALPSTVE